MLQPLRTRLAESLIETIIAITVIALSSAATLSMLRTSLKGNTVIGEKLIALQLAEEGLDAIKNIRDTNYLLFSSAADECWNKLGALELSDCMDETQSEITDGEEYYLYQDFAIQPFYRWNLIPTSETRDGDLNLFQFSANGSTLPFYSDWHNVSTSGFTTLSSSPFNRVVNVEYDPVDESGVDLCPNDECFEATVTVEWTVASLTQSVSLSRLITHVY